MLRDVLLRLRSVLRRSAVERELDEELRFHLEREIDKNRSLGLGEHDAIRKAQMDLGGFELIKEETRDARGISFLEVAISDIRYAARVLRNSPGFTSVAILSLALGVGANAAIFELIDAVRLRTLPVKNPQSLVEIHVADMSGARGARTGNNTLTYPIWEQIRTQQTAFSGVFAWSDAEFNLSPKGEVHSVPGLWVSGNFFDVLGVQPVLGRVFSESDDYRGCGSFGAVISYSFWKSEFAGSTSVLGKKVIVNGEPVNVIGVTTPQFFGLEVGREFQIALPICSVARTGAFDAVGAGTYWWLSVMGRLKAESTLQRASAQLASVSPGLFQTTLPAKYPPVSVGNYLHMKLTADPAASGLSDLRDQYSDLLWILLAIAGAVLLNASANVANLMLARAGLPNA